jgi:hypothetical protein
MGMMGLDNDVYSIRLKVEGVEERREEEASYL